MCINIDAFTLSTEAQAGHYKLNTHIERREAKEREKETHLETINLTAASPRGRDFGGCVQSCVPNKKVSLHGQMFCTDGFNSCCEICIDNVTQAHT